MTITIMQLFHHVAVTNLSWRTISCLDCDDADWCYPQYPDHILSHSG